LGTPDMNSIKYCPICGSVLSQDGKCPRCDAREVKLTRRKAEVMGMGEVAIKDVEVQNIALRARIRELESAIRGLRELIGHIQSDAERAQKESEVRRVSRVSFTKAMISFTFAGLLIGSLFGYLGAYLIYRSKADDYERQIAALRSEISLLNSSLNDANAIISTLEAQVRELRANLFKVAPNESLVVGQFERKSDGSYVADISDTYGGSVSNITVKTSYMPGWTPLAISMRHANGTGIKSIVAKICGEGFMPVYPEYVDDVPMSSSSSRFYEVPQGSVLDIEFADGEPLEGDANFILILSPSPTQLEFLLELNITLINYMRPTIQKAQVSNSFPLREAEGMAVFFVSPDGNDNWSGRSAEPNEVMPDGPFATLERARDAIRALRRDGLIPRGGVTVYLRGGIHLREAPFTLTAEDGGTEASPIVYCPYDGGEVRLVGGKQVNGFEEVTDPAVLARLDPRARGHVLQADLRSQGITDYGDLQRRGFGCPILPSALELFFQDEPMQLARWPNDNWTKIVAVPNGQNGGAFVYEGDRPARWKDVEDVWVHGYWTYDWADSYEKIKAIDLNNHEVTTYEPHGVYGYTVSQRYYFLNVLEELDDAGEWYLDRKAGILYFWPPAPAADGKAFVSTLEGPIVSMQNVSYVSLRGLTFECTRGSAVVIVGGSHDLIFGCTFRNIGDVAVCIGAGLEDAYNELYRNTAWNRVGGYDNGVVGCTIYETGEGGVILGGGDRKGLVPAHNFAVNDIIHDYQRISRTYRPAIAIDGVGNRIAHNLIYNSPHSAIILHGNDHLIELNEIHNVCMETNDAGAFYMGRDFTERGNVVRYNYFHDLGNASMVQAVYLDDCSSGTTVFGNLFCRAGRAVQIGGGRDNTIENNIFVDCNPAVQVDARGLTWAKFWFDGSDNTLIDRLRAMDYDKPPYSVHYPELARILEDEPAVPKGNRIVRNICAGGQWLELLDGLTDEDVDIKDNLVDGHQGFVSPDEDDYQLREDSPAYKLGFRRIPIEDIGLYLKAMPDGTMPQRYPPG